MSLLVVLPLTVKTLPAATELLTRAAQFERFAAHTLLVVREHGLTEDQCKDFLKLAESVFGIGEAIRTARFTLLVAYAEGPALEDYVHVASVTETQATAAANARKRALSDAERIRRALCFPALYSGGVSPEIVSLSREGASTVERLFEGVLLCATTYRVVIAVPMGTSFDP